MSEPKMLRWYVIEDRNNRAPKQWGIIEAPTRKKAERLIKKQPCWTGLTLRVELQP